MKINKFVIILLAGLILPIFSLANPAKAQEIDPNFDPNNIISDADLLNYNSMSLPDIQNFLQSKGSFLANYYALNAHGTTKTAAEIIYDATHNNFDCAGVTLSDTPTEAEKQLKCRKITTVSPKFILVLLQKEASLIENPNPIQSRLDWATGYGCPDNWTCNPYYKGFGKQVNSAALQFLAYVQEQYKYAYRAGETYTFTNPYGTISKEPVIVTPVNKATAALYNYTPHVYNGNYNVYKLWNRYFPKSSNRYPDGSLLSGQDEPGVWLIENGQKRPFLNYSAFISRFQPSQIIKVDPSELDNYDLGPSLKFSNYSLVQTPDKKIYLLVGREKRLFESLATFKKIGFNPAEIETATDVDLASYQAGKTITATSTYVTGALLQDTKTGGIFYVENGTKAPLLDKILLSVKFKNKKTIPASPATLEKYTTVAPILLDDGTLVKTTAFPTVYLISNGQKRPFADEAAFAKLGYNYQNIIVVSSQFLYNYPLGEIIKQGE